MDVAITFDVSTPMGFQVQNRIDSLTNLDQKLYAAAEAHYAKVGKERMHSWSVSVSLHCVCMPVSSTRPIQHSRDLC